MKLKRIMALVLCFAMALGTMSFSVFAEETAPVAAKIDDVEFPTIDQAIAAADEGDTVFILGGEYEQDLNINKKITVVGETLEDGYQLAAITGKLNITADGATVKGLYVYNDGENAAYISAKDVLVEGCEIASGGKSAFRYCYTDGTVTFKDSVIAGDVYGIHFDGKIGGNIVIENCKIQGWTSFASTIEKVTISDSEFADAAYNVLRFYQDAEVTNTTFTEGMRIDSGSNGTGMEGIALKFSDCEMADGSDFKDCFPSEVIAASTVIVDDETLESESTPAETVVATVGGEDYTTLSEAIENANGETITLVDDTAEEIQIADGANVVIDLNSNTLSGCFKPFKGSLTLSGGTIDNNNGEYSAIEINEGSLVLTDVNITSARHAVRIDGEVDATINGGTYQPDATSGTRHALNVSGAANVTIQDGTFIGPRVTTMDSGSAVAVQSGATVTIKDGNFSGGKNATLGVSGTLTVYGGAFDQTPSAYLAEGYAALPDLNGNFVVGTKPTATVKNLGSMTIPAGDYHNLGNGGNSADMPLNFVMQFVADQDAEDMQTSPFANWYADFVITFEGIEGDSFDAEGCYLAGYYGSTEYWDGLWAKIPVEGILDTIEEDVRYPVMMGVGAPQTYDYICSGVQEFSCAMFIPETILAANPDLKVNLELNIVDSSEDDKALEALKEGKNFYQASKTSYNAADFSIYAAKIGTTKYETLEAAFEDATATDIVVLNKNLVLNTPVTIAKGKEITLDLNGFTITGTDTTEKNYGLFQNNGKFTVKDSVGGGAIKISATIDSGWNRYSAVISNNPGGTLVVDGGTIEHLGGTAMAYGIDSLTNGGIGAVDVTINGGTIKSTYRAIRQFLNSDSTLNKLTVNGGTIEGENKAIFFHDPSKKANLGAITVGEEADVNGGVYLFVTEGSTEWPVEVSISAKAVDKVIPANVPAGYEVALSNGSYGVIENPASDAYVAEINGVKYATLQEAFDNASTGDIITLITNITLGATVKVKEGKNVVLDLNGKSIDVGYQSGSTTKHLYAIDNYGTLKLTSSNGEGVITARGIENFNTLTVEDGVKIVSCDTNGGAAIWNEATLTVSGGIFTTSTTDKTTTPAPGALNNSGTAEINGGTFIATGGAYTIISSGDMTVENAVITGRGGIAVSGGEVTVNDGTKITTDVHNNTAHAMYVSGGKLIVNGGTFTAFDDDNCGNSTVCVMADAAVEIKGGTFITNEHTKAPYIHESATTATLAISGGAFSTDVSEYVADGYASIKSENNGLWNVIAARKVTLVPSVEANSEGEIVVKTGETFTVDVKIEGIDAGGVRWVLDYDDTKFELDGIDTHGFNVVEQSVDYLTVDIADTIANGSTVATYTFTALNDAVTDSQFTLTYTELMTVDEAWKEMDVTDITIAVNTDITIELREIEYTVFVDGIDINAPECNPNPSYDGQEHTLSVNVTEPADASITYTVNGVAKDSIAITKEGVWNIGYTITKEGYETVNGTYTLTIRKPEFKVEVGMTEAEDYVGGYKLVLVYTNADKVAFDYNGIQMLDASDSKYLYNGTDEYEHVFALVVEAIQTTDIEEYKKLVTVDYEDDAADIDYEVANDVNFSKTVNFNDIVAAYAVLEKDEDTFANYMAGVIKADVDFSKTARTEDITPIIREVYAE